MVARPQMRNVQIQKVRTHHAYLFRVLNWCSRMVPVLVKLDQGCFCPLLLENGKVCVTATLNEESDLKNCMSAELSRQMKTDSVLAVSTEDVSLLSCDSFSPLDAEETGQERHLPGDQANFNVADNSRFACSMKRAFTCRH